MYWKPKFLVALVFSLLFCATSSIAVDTAKVLKPALDKDKRALHKNEVIYRSLQITEGEFGVFKFETVDLNMHPGRGLESIKDGNLINVGIVPHNSKWDQYTLAVKVPVRQGLLSYRLLLVNKQDLSKYSQVKTLDDLKELTAGLQTNWATTRVFQHLELNHLTGHNFEGLFLMLKKRRFDYIPRAVYEIYDELDNRKDVLNDIVIEPNLALYLPMPSYVYVSPEEPRLAQRIEAGLTKMQNNGELKAIFEKYYAEDISRANLQNRTLINLASSPH